MHLAVSSSVSINGWKGAKLSPFTSNTCKTQLQRGTGEASRSNLYLGHHTAPTALPQNKHNKPGNTPPLIELMQPTALCMHSTLHSFARSHRCACRRQVSVLFQVNRQLPWVHACLKDVFSAVSFFITMS